MTCLSPPLTPTCSVGLQFLAQGLSLLSRWIAPGLIHKCCWNTHHYNFPSWIIYQNIPPPLVTSHWNGLIEYYSITLVQKHYTGFCYRYSQCSAHALSQQRSKLQGKCGGSKPKHCITFSSWLINLIYVKGRDKHLIVTRSGEADQGWISRICDLISSLF